MDKNSFKKIIHKLSWIDILLNCIPFIIIVISIFYFFSKSNFTAFEPNTHSFIPAFELKIVMILIFTLHQYLKVHK